MNCAVAAGTGCGADLEPLLETHSSSTPALQETVEGYRLKPEEVVDRRTEAERRFDERQVGLQNAHRFLLDRVC